MALVGMTSSENQLTGRPFHFEGVVGGFDQCKNLFLPVSVQFICLFFFIYLPNVHNKLVTENKKTLINNN